MRETSLDGFFGVASIKCDKMIDSNFIPIDKSELFAVFARARQACNFPITFWIDFDKTHFERGALVFELRGQKNYLIC